MLCAAWGAAVALPLFAPGSVSGTVQAVANAMMGAGLAGLICAPLFGHAGRGGVALALLGGLLCTALGAALGGAAMFGAHAGVPAIGVIGGAIIQSPLILLLWGCCLLVVHLGARWLRR